MENFINMQTNVFMIVFMIIVVITASTKVNKFDKLSKVYIIACSIVIVQLALESLLFFLDGNQGKNIHNILISVNLFNFINGPILVLYWFMLLRRIFINVNNRKPRKIELLIYLPQVINIILVLTTVFTKKVFYIDDNNVYHRGDWFFVTALITYFYLICAIITVARNKKNVYKNEFLILITANLIPIIGGVIQIFFYGTSLIWPSVAASLIYTYIFLQHRIVQYDSLTKSWRRETLLNYVNQIVTLNKDYNFGALYIDLNRLKEINDNYGHFQGDLTLKKITEIVKESIGKNNFIARIGGDEFVVVLDVKSISEVDNYRDKILSAIDEYNHNSDFSFNISLSIGGDIFDKRFKSFDEFLNHIDELMYYDKKTYNDINISKKDYL